MSQGSTIVSDRPAATAYAQLFEEYARVFLQRGDLAISDDLVRVARSVADAVSKAEELRPDAKLGLLTAGVAWGAQPALLVGLNPDAVSERLVRDISLVIERASHASDGTISLSEVVSSARANWAELSLCKEIWGM